MNEQEKKTERKSMIQTAVLSVFLFLFSTFVIYYVIGSEIMRDIGPAHFITGAALLAVSALYYFVIMRQRKSDVYFDSNKHRIRLSLLIQEGITVCYLLPQIIESIFSPHKENAQFAVAVLSSLIYLAVPLLIHLVGCLFWVIFNKKSCR